MGEKGRVSWRRQHFRRNSKDEEVFSTVRKGSGESFRVEEPAGAKTQRCVRGDQQGLQIGDKYIAKVK